MTMAAARLRCSHLRFPFVLLCVCGRIAYSFLNLQSARGCNGALTAIAAKGRMCARPTQRILTGAHPRHWRTELHESIRANREKIERARIKLRAAMRAGQSEQADRLKAYIMHLRKLDPQFAAEDAMNAALAKGLYSTAAKHKLRLEEVKQNPFRQSLLDTMPGSGSGGDQWRQVSGGGGDPTEDMSWGFDQTFFQRDKSEDSEDDDDYDDI